MMLSPKAIRFVIEAIEYRIAWYEQQLEQEGINDDDHSDLENDLFYFKEILSDLKSRSPSP